MCGIVPAPRRATGFRARANDPVRTAVSLLLGLLTFTFADAEASFVGTFGGGVFVYAMSVLDAYRTAALRRLVETSSVGCADGAEAET